MQISLHAMEHQASTSVAAQEQIFQPLSLKKTAAQWFAQQADQGTNLKLLQQLQTPGVVPAEVYEEVSDEYWNQYGVTCKTLKGHTSGVTALAVVVKSY